MTIDPPHPYALNMPDTNSIKTVSSRWQWFNLKVGVTETLAGNSRLLLANE